MLVLVVLVLVVLLLIMRLRLLMCMGMLLRRFGMLLLCRRVVSGWLGRSL